MTTGPKKNRWLDPLPKVIRTAVGVKRAKREFHQFVANPNADDMATLAEMLASGQLVPEIQRTIGFDEVAAGLAEIGSGHARAKIVIRP